MSAVTPNCGAPLRVTDTCDSMSAHTSRRGVRNITATAGWITSGPKLSWVPAALVFDWGTNLGSLADIIPVDDRNQTVTLGIGDLHA